MGRDYLPTRAHVGEEVQRNLFPTTTWAREHGAPWMIPLTHDIECSCKPPPWALDHLCNEVPLVAAEVVEEQSQPSQKMLEHQPSLSSGMSSRGSTSPRPR